MSTLISFIQEEPKHFLQTKTGSKLSKIKKEVEIKAPSIPSNRERIINVKKNQKKNQWHSNLVLQKDDVVLNVKGFYNDLDSRIKQQNVNLFIEHEFSFYTLSFDLKDILKKVLEKSQKILASYEKKEEDE